ncbi:acetyl-CoA:L-glutamate N-acetyltransferase NDAI_0G05660 [Naumovozyma dairenensis CBS 421]|uniref:Amino-acid acetyltransferase, mitochondrial n=1 Tax=Naumovozyma dairenensis (strain ATCC 10597 / BCRC 20456 / CBS 421 / NBRC 0211 / NRRL Y-12639) TaxID=1071378 RepID=J7REK7_NAUDC|nr:hypothetical protein NDAI_0G05660 [Naumovozyma dairenensis CBS 421]CCK73549.1 hypothetical protein NDAI_0G05660 [Naumovozyma dairenensis CBS 421]
MWKHIFSNGLRYEQQNASSKNLILSVLNTTTTKREAKDYLTKYTNEQETINHCLLFIRHLHAFPTQTLSKLSNSIKRLRMLGLRPICIVPPTTAKLVTQHSEILDKLLTDAELHPLHFKEGLSKSRTGLFHSVLSSESQLFDGTIVDMVPIIKPYIYNEETASEYMAPNVVKFLDHLCQNVTTHIDKFFILNQIGGIPSIERNENAHVFINLSQEYEKLALDLKKELKYLAKREPESSDLLHRMELYAKEEQIVSMEGQLNEHLQNLQLMDAVLSNLSTTATGLITKVSTAALSSDNKNPLVYNVLTDRSLISSSLPRFKNTRHNQYSHPDLHFHPTNLTEQDPVYVTTVFKKGIHTRIFDYPTLTQYNTTGLPLEFHIKSTGRSIPNLAPDLKLDLLKLERIINASFRRKLDLEDYLRRINGKIASIIVLGDYEGIAILTYEGSKEKPFIYLDKFAVMPKMKGSLGISDIIFNIIFQKYPNEVVWRSRKDNVVNKWYFQRSVGVFSLSLNLDSTASLIDQKDSIFNLFYYGDPDNSDKKFKDVTRLKEYAKYVRDIQPSWQK